MTCTLYGASPRRQLVIRLGSLLFFLSWKLMGYVCVVLQWRNMGCNGLDTNLTFAHKLSYDCEEGGYDPTHYSSRLAR